MLLKHSEILSGTKNLFMKKIILLILLVGCISIPAQVVYEPLFSDVYSFLSRLSQRGVIDFDDHIKPLPRTYIAEKLLEAAGKHNQLTELEKEEINFYRKDFFNEEIMNSDLPLSEKHMSYFSKDVAGRYRLFSYTDNLFKLNVSPIYGYETGINKGKRVSHFWSGVSLYGYVTDAIGFSFNYRDNNETGETIDKTKNFTPVTGVNNRTDANVYQYRSDKSEYSEIRTMISANWDWGSVSVGKDFLGWGYGEGGEIVLSQKAPSFPFVRLDLKPVDWLSFNYFHGWLMSDVPDSTSIYTTRVGTERFLFREKFIASHTLTITPITGLDVSIGESMIYSDRLEVSYLMPFMFFRLADHYLSRHYNYAGSNAQVFASISSKNHLKNTHLYSSLIIDEIVLGTILDKEKQRYQMGFSLGGSITDLLIDNFILTVEFAKLYPFVYDHFNQTQGYTNAAYNLGHWIGNNGDQFYVSAGYRILRGLALHLSGQYIRKGDRGTPDVQQFEPVQPPFLFGDRTHYTMVGAEAKYEITHEMSVRGRYNFLQTKSDIEGMDSNSQEFRLAFYYGL